MILSSIFYDIIFYPTYETIERVDNLEIVIHYYHRTYSLQYKNKKQCDNDWHNIRNNKHNSGGDNDRLSLFFDKIELIA